MTTNKSIVANVRDPQVRAALRRGDPQYVYCGRGNRRYGLPHSKWHNPCVVEGSGEAARAAAIQGFREYLLSRADLLADLHELRGKTLVCWCAPLPCHCDVLAELAVTHE